MICAFHSNPPTVRAYMCIYLQETQACTNMYTCMLDLAGVHGCVYTMAAGFPKDHSDAHLDLEGIASPLHHCCLKREAELLP